MLDLLAIFAFRASSAQHIGYRLRDDIEMTREIKTAAKALGITIHDHPVIGRGGHAIPSLGLLS